MNGRRDDGEEPTGYEPPQVEDLPAPDGTAVTAADAGGDSPPPVNGPEWRPVAPEDQTP